MYWTGKTGYEKQISAMTNNIIIKKKNLIQLAAILDANFKDDSKKLRWHY